MQFAEIGRSLSGRAEAAQPVLVWLSEALGTDSSQPGRYEGLVRRRGTRSVHPLSCVRSDRNLILAID